jgi:hypothetical protein
VPGREVVRDVKTRRNPVPLTAASPAPRCLQPLLHVPVEGRLAIQVSVNLDAPVKLVAD